MDDGRSNGGSSFEIKHRSDAAEVTYVNEVRAHRLDVWLDKYRYESNITPILRTGASEVKVRLGRDEELVNSCTERSGIFLVWSGGLE